MAIQASPPDLRDKSESRYELLEKIAAGGMATVYVGRLRGAVGFWRLVAIKQAHTHLVENPTFKQMLINEARLASRLHHPNVVAVLDVEELAGELRLVMDYVEGASLAELISRGSETDQRLPARLAVRIALDVCAGLHAAHELCNEDGKPLGLVHRDVSPHNILVGIDGMSRLSDFGIAKQAEGGGLTATGALKGKVGYMAPEYVEHGKLDARSDVFALGVVVWEALTSQKLFRGSNEVDTLKRIMATEVPPLSSVAPWAGKQLDDVLAYALAHAPAERFASALAFGMALECAARKDDLIASHAEVGAHVRTLVGASLDRRRAQIRERLAPSQPEDASAGRPGSTTKPLQEQAPQPPLGETPAPPVMPLVSAYDRPTVPDKPPRYPDPSEPTDARSHEQSRTTLMQSIFDVPGLPPPGRWKAVIAVGIAAAAVGVLGVLALAGTHPVAPPAGTARGAPPLPTMGVSAARLEESSPHSPLPETMASTAKTAAPAAQPHATALGVRPGYAHTARSRPVAAPTMPR